MKKLIGVWGALFFCTASVWGDVTQRLNIFTNDGACNTYPYKATFPIGSCIDNLDGTVTLSFTGGTQVSLSTGVTGSLPIAFIASGTLPSNIVASSITAGIVGPGQVVKNSSYTIVASTALYSLLVPASGVQSGTLGTSVIASSVGAGTVGPPQVVLNSTYTIAVATSVYSLAAPASGITGILGVSNGGTGQSALSAFYPTIQEFTTSAGTYTTPAGVTWIHVHMVGGGGGGGGSGTTTSGGQGGSGGNTYFGTVSGLAALGGSGAQNPSNFNTGGGGGTATLGTIGKGFAISGGIGGQGSQPGSFIQGAMGAASALGGAGGGATGQAGGAGATNTGGGGGGGGSGGTSAYTGSGGGSGGYVDAIITGPAATYGYTVGGAGNAGGAGTNGFAGGAGGSGLIVVEEHYF